MLPDELTAMIGAELRRRGWTRYQLALRCAGRATMRTVYAVVAGKPAKVPALLAVLDALEITINPTDGK